LLPPRNCRRTSPPVWPIQDRSSRTGHPNVGMFTRNVPTIWEGYSRKAVESLRLDRPQPRLEPTIASPGHEQAEKRPQRAETQKRSMFAGLKLNAGRGAAQERGAASQAARPGRGESLRPAPAQDWLAERVRPLSGFEQAVDHYARAFSAADKQLRQDLPILETQKQELYVASERLDQSRRDRTS